jgi:hypothetical protein
MDKPATEAPTNVESIYRVFDDNQEYHKKNYEYMGKTWIIGMEIINNGQYEQPYFIKPLKNKKTR